jgi:AI-2 transport protein TqsA
MIQKATENSFLPFVLAIASVFVILFGVRALATILNPILLAIVITITVLPLPGWLSKRGVPGWLALVLTILLVAAILGLVILTVVLSVSRLSVQLPAYVVDGTNQLSRELQNLLTDPSALIGRTRTISNTLSSPLVQQVLGIAAGIVVQFGLTLLIFFFMLSAAINLPDATRLGLDPNATSVGRIQGLTGDVRRYMTILTGINFMVGMGNTILLLILGVDYALLWGILAWFMGYIPSVGFIIALVPPLLLAYAEYGLTTALIVLVGYVVINGGIQNFVQPKIMGQGVQLSPLVVFVSLFVWGFLLGGVGAILAVPLTLLVVNIMDNFESTRGTAALMRYTGQVADEEPDGVTQEALGQLKGAWYSFRASLPPGLGGASGPVETESGSD